MKLDKKKKVLIILISIIFILILCISAYLASINSKEDNKNIKESDSSNQNNSTRNNEEKMEKLKKVSESERIRIYLGEYFNYVENKDYESAYNLLYSKYKENYFPTLEDYKEYMENNNYPDMLSIDYDDIKTQGYYYIVTVRIGDMLSSSDTTKQEKTFIIKEEDYNEFYLSFKL